MMESVKEFAQELERLATISQAEASEPITALKQKLEDQVYLFRREGIACGVFVITINNNR